MTRQAVAGDVGGRAGPGSDGSFGGVPVEPGHRLDRCREQVGRALRRLDRGGDDPRAQRLGQHQVVPGPGPVVGQHHAGVDLADGDHPVLGLGVVDGVTAHHRNPGFPGLFGPAPDDLFGQSLVEEVAREGEQVQGEERPPAHGVDVRQGIRRGDAAEVVGIVDDRGEEVEGHHQRAAVGELVHGCIVTRGCVHEDSGVVHREKVTQNLRQLGLAELTRSPGAVGQGAEPDPGSLVVGFAGHGERYRAALDRQPFGGQDSALTQHPSEGRLPPVGGSLEPAHEDQPVNDGSRRPGRPR